MSIQLTTPEILNIAKVCQYLTVVDSSTRTVRKGADINRLQARLIYMERKAVQNRYDLDPNDATLVATGNYLFSLLRNWPAAQNIINQIALGLPVISNPPNRAISVGQSTTFSVTVTSSSPYTIQWFKNGVLIPGATGLTYAVSNAQLSDSGSGFTAVATNAAGSAGSLPGILTVTSGLTAQWWYGSTDPFAALSAGDDTLDYQISQSITTNSPIPIDYPAAAENNMFNVLRYPNTEVDKTTWENGLNSGIIPDITMRPILNINGYKYVISRDAMSLDNSQTTLTYS